MANLKDLYEQYLAAVVSKQCFHTKKYIDEHRAAFANNRHSAGFSNNLKQLTFALTIARARDAYVYDLDGNAYLDISMGFGVHLFGHSPDFMVNAINAQMEKGFSLGPLYEDASKLARLICDMTGNDRCAFYNSGTEAIMVALRLARAATGKNKVVIFEGSYHGTFDPLLVMKSSNDYRAVANVPGITESLVHDTILLPFNDAQSLRYIAEHANEIAAVLTEPVRSRHPEVIVPEFLYQVGTLCKQHDIAFVLDEVVTGFRIANGGAKEIFDLQPDITVYGKVAGGGMPIGIVAGRKKFLDYVDGGKWNFSDESSPMSSVTFVAGTFCHHPLAMATAIAILEKLQSAQGRIQKELNERTNNVCRRINEFCHGLGIPVEAVNFGSLFRFILKGRNKIFYHSLLKEKIYLWEGRNCFLSTAHDDAAINSFIQSVQKCLLEMKAAGYFPKSRNAVPFSHSASMQTGILVDHELDTGKLELAFGYVCECISFTNRRAYNYRFKNVTDDEAELQADIILCASVISSQTFLQLKVAREQFDGWSMIQVLRFLGLCYDALESGINLPVNPFTEMKRHSLSHASHTISDASTISRFVPVPVENISFELILACFALAVDQPKLKVSVPLSGQLLSRQLHAVGQHTVYACIDLEDIHLKDRVTLVNTIAAQLHSPKFDEAKRTPHPQSEIIFNVDNVKKDFRFGARQVKLMPLEDSKTSYDIVVNVIIEPTGLHLSIKSRKETDRAYYDELVQKFCSLILKEIHVPAQS